MNGPEGGRYDSPEIVHAHLTRLLTNRRRAGDLASEDGFEPPTYGFGDHRSANWNYTEKLERGKGIEPSTLAWKAKVIPFYEPRIKLGTPYGN